MSLNENISDFRGISFFVYIINSWLSVCDNLILANDVNHMQEKIMIYNFGISNELEEHHKNYIVMFINLNLIRKKNFFVILFEKKF